MSTLSRIISSVGDKPEVDFVVELDSESAGGVAVPVPAIGFRSISRQTSCTAGAWLVALLIRGGLNTGQRGIHFAKSALVTIAEYGELVDLSCSKFVSQTQAR